MSDERTKEKKEWRKPELIILMRNKPEEAVLAACKYSFGANGPTGAAVSCVNYGGGTIPGCTAPCTVNALS